MFAAIPDVHELVRIANKAGENIRKLERGWQDRSSASEGLVRLILFGPGGPNLAALNASSHGEAQLELMRILASLSVTCQPTLTASYEDERLKMTFTFTWSRWTQTWSASSEPIRGLPPLPRHQGVRPRERDRRTRERG